MGIYHNVKSEDTYFLLPYQTDSLIYGSYKQLGNIELILFVSIHPFLVSFHFVSTPACMFGLLVLPRGSCSYC